ncbi:Phosphate:acyl-ACP acyltransferase PlsX [Dissulfuribacter thermophilus]|uniref:Phosphate acyltransferase n=1 Tax=Dissulfuribacter thermophilus TaxID=1156395 RepID=A0A1B9F7K2_9BACT|nr:phosphate acyltransferase PlsX [Dissulfuribacter thermophilus]OCC15917.1 Phosphate:acyl-ACP acyltransferase PlsX [Dissulfuribacter thermophilus]
MPVAVDAMGGDHGPQVLVEGAILAAKEFGVESILVGDEAILRKALEESGEQGLPIGIKHASQVVEMDEAPSEALRKKKNSTIKVAFELVKEGNASSVVSAGNSGATMASALVTLGRIKGVRPAIATVMPTLKEPVVMIDVGANVDCKPIHLYQFAVMGNVFAREHLKKPNPRIGLLSIGEEDTKGNVQVKKAYDMLVESGLNFVGNVEGREVFKGDVDVIVCDGFVGNICLKLSEGLAESILQMLKQEIEGSLVASMGYALAKKAFKKFRKKVDYAEYGGAPLLGINGIAIICHGRSKARAIKNAIKVANDLSDVNLNLLLERSL